VVENACSTAEQSVIPVEIKGLRLQVVESGLNEPTGHVWQADPSQYSSILHDVHEVEVALPPALNEPTGHAWQADPAQYSLASHAHIYKCPVPIVPVGQSTQADPSQYSLAEHASTTI
jgi:hypothetical protein